MKDLGLLRVPSGEPENPVSFNEISVGRDSGPTALTREAPRLVHRDGQTSPGGEATEETDRAGA